MICRASKQLITKRSAGGFTIMELLVAMALMMVLVAISAVVFRSAVKAYRTASATTEILRKYRAITTQLDADLQGLRKDGEFIIVWAPGAVRNPDDSLLDEDGDGVPDRYDSFDRLYFFADGNFQTYNEQPTTTPGTTRIVNSNLARICYSFGREMVDPDDPLRDIEVYQQIDNRKRMLCRTQHLVVTDDDLMVNMPVYDPINLPTGWTPGWNGFWTINNRYEYQSGGLANWMAYNADADWWNNIKVKMLEVILDLHFDVTSTTNGGPRLDLVNRSDLHNLLCQGVGQFHVQIWRADLHRWFPEIDPNYDGDYSDADAGPDRDDGLGYYTDGDGIDVENLKGRMLNFFPGDDFDTLIGPALKFTFTLYDSNRIFPDGKTFTHIVYLN